MSESKPVLAVRVRLDNVGPLLQALREYGLSVITSWAEMVLVLDMEGTDFGGLIGRLGALKDVPGVVEAHYDVFRKENGAAETAVQLPLSVQD